MSGTNSLIVAGQDTSGDLFINGSYYFALGGTAIAQATEANVQRKLPAGTASGLGTQMVVNTYGGATIAGLWFRIASANSTVTVPLNGVGVGWFQDTTHSASVTAGQLCNLAWTGNSGAPDIEFATNCLTFNAASPLSSMLWASGAGLAFSSASNTFQLPAVGQSGATVATEAPTQFVVRAAGTYEKLECFVSADSIATAGSTVRLRIGGVNGNQILSIPILTTGQFQDTTHSDPVVSGSLVNYLVNAGAASNSITLNLIDVSNAGTISAQDLVNGASGAGYNLAQTSQFYPLSGTTNTGVTTESHMQIKTNYATTLSRLRTNVTVNTASVTTHMVSRKNTAAGNMTIALTNGVTGTFEDTTHSDSIAGTDLVNTEFVANAGSGSSVVTYIAVTSDDGSFSGIKKGGFFHVFP